MDAPFLLEGEKTWSRSTVASAVEATCADWVDRGLRPGESIAMHLSHDAQGVIALLSAWQCGAVPVPISSRLPARAVADLEAMLGARWRLGGAEDAGGAALFCVTPPAGRAGDWSRLQAMWTAVEPGRRATILLSSGSTGRAKAVVHTAQAHLQSARTCNAAVDFDASGCWFLSLPLYHVGGLALVVRALIAGACLRISERAGGLEALHASNDVTHVSLVTAQLRRLLQFGTPVPAGLRCVLLGGGPMQAELVAAARAAAWPLRATWGMTEAASGISMDQGPCEQAPAGGSGTLLEGWEVRVESDGSLAIRGDALCQGRLDGSGVLQALATDDGWYRTGDRGRVDAEGNVWITGRADLMFVSGGENVYPEVIEAAIGRTVSLEDAVVIPVPCAAYGERPVAVLAGWTGTPDEAEIRRRLREALPGFMVPVAVLELPAWAMGTAKVDRRAVRDWVRALDWGDKLGDGVA